MSYFPDAANWPNIKSLICIESHRTEKGKTTISRRYYLSSLEWCALKLLLAIIAHWSIENNLHWRLDVTFNEDKARTKYLNCPENLAIARKIALYILDSNKSNMGGYNKRMELGWNDNNLLNLIEKFINSL